MDVTVRALAGIASVSLVVACVAAVSPGDDASGGFSGDMIWRQEIELLEGQVAHIDSRALSIYLEDTAVDSATVTLSKAGSERTVTLRTGIAGEESWPPYAVRLVYTGINGSATLEVAKFRE